MTCRRCRDGVEAVDVVDMLEGRDGVLGERSGYKKCDEGGWGVDTPSALASLASLPGAMGVRERGLPKGEEGSKGKQRGFGPVDGEFVVVGVDGCGFGFGGISFRKAKEGTGAAVVQDIVGVLKLL